MTIGLTKDFSPRLRVGGGWGEGEPAINPPPIPITPTPPQGGGKCRASIWLFIICCLSLLTLFWANDLRALQILDDRGVAVALAAPPQRIISLYGGLTEILQGLGLGPRLVARIQGDDSLKDVPMVGTHLQPNVEMILALKPDLVVQGGVPKGLAALKKLEAEGVPVAMFAPHDFPELFSAITRLGELTGQQEAAAALNRAMDEKLQTVARRVAGRKPLRVFFEVRYENLLAAGRGSMVNDIITRAGGVNVVESPQGMVPFSLEALLVADPEVYIIQQGPMNRSPEDIYTRPYFQELRAVKQRRVLLVDERLFSHPGPRAADAVTQLARFLHPQAWGEEQK
jgi:iron complex transport system substrate-binding protein